MSLTLTALASDNFQRANENPLSDGGNWTTPSYATASLELVSDAVQVPGNNGAHEEQYTGVTWPNDQYCKVVLGAVVNPSAQANSINLFCRQSTSADTEYFASLTFKVLTTARVVRLGYKINGTQTIISSNVEVNYATGDVWVFAVVGNTLYLYQNGTLVVSAQDTGNNITSGEVGFELNVGTGNSLTGLTVTSWEGGSAAQAGDAYDPTLPFLGSVSEASVDNGGPYCGHVAVLASAPPGLPNPYLGRRFKVSSAPAGPNDTFIGQVVVVSGPPEGFVGNDNELGYHVEK
jgi:hypothetical protein